MRISDWSSDVCSSDLVAACRELESEERWHGVRQGAGDDRRHRGGADGAAVDIAGAGRRALAGEQLHARRSEEHTSELQSLMRISYAVFCLKKKNSKINVQLRANTTRELAVHTQTHPQAHIRY